MKAWKLTGIGQMDIFDVPAPQIKSDRDVLLKIKAVGVCGSDVHYYTTGKIGSQVVQYPFAVGHECSAVVEKVGAGVAHFKSGDLVAVDPAIACHDCDQCRSGRENTCRKLNFLGCPGQIEGCLCEYIVMPEDCLYKVGPETTAQEAMICEPLSIGMYAVKQAGLPGPDAAIAIMGCGPIGLSCMLGARDKGISKIYVTEKIDARAAIAKKQAASWAGNTNACDVVKEITRREPSGMDAVFECAGKQETLDEAIEILKPGGKLILVGIPEFDRVSFAIDKMRRKELTVVNIRRQNKCVQDALELIGRIDVNFMITHRFAFGQVKDAFDMVAAYRDGVVKAVIEF